MKIKEKDSTPDWEEIPKSELRKITERWHGSSGFGQAEMESLVGIRPGKSKAKMKLAEIGRLKGEFICALIAR